MTSPLSAIAVEYYGGAAGRIAKDATAFPHRDLPWDIIMLAQWTDAARTEEQRSWARAACDSLRGFSEGAHLLGAIDAEPQEVWTARSDRTCRASPRSRADATQTISSG